MTRFHAYARRAALLGALAVGLGGCFAPPPPNKFVVFFVDNSAGLDAAAEGVVRDAAAAAVRTVPTVPVIVAGYADGTGGPRPPLAMSELRAQRVAEVLEADGVPRARIQLRPRGNQGGDPGVESRRVEILVGG